MERSEVERLRAILREHWLFAVTCNEETHTDTTSCSCARFRCEPQPNVGEAVERWIDHIVEVLAATTPSVGADTTPTGTPPIGAKTEWKCFESTAPTDLEQRARASVNKLAQWRSLYPRDYIRKHFVIWNHDGEAEGIVDAYAFAREREAAARLAAISRSQEECQGVIGDWGGPERANFTNALHRCWDALEHLKKHWDCERWPFCEHFLAAPRSETHREEQT